MQPVFIIVSARIPISMELIITYPYKIIWWYNTTLYVWTGNIRLVKEKLRMGSRYQPIKNYLQFKKREALIWKVSRLVVWNISWGSQWLTVVYNRYQWSSLLLYSTSLKYILLSLVYFWHKSSGMADNK